MAHQKKQAAPERDQTQQPENKEAAEPRARKLIAYFGKEGDAYCDQKNHGPRRGEPHVLLFVAAEGLYLINVSGLER